MKKKTMRFLAISLAILITVCIGVMIILTVITNEQSEDTMNEVGNIYMSGMSEKISMHFETTINLRVAQIETITKDIPPDEAEYGSDMLEQLSRDGQIREFDYLALYDENGNFEMIYGENVSIIHPEPFMKSLSNGEKKVSVALNESGEKVLIMGIPVSYPLADGGHSIALVAGLPIEYINEILSLDESDSLTYSHIIRRDGSYVIRSVEEYGDNYFDRIEGVFSDLNGKNHEQYISELKNAMENDEDYSTVLVIGDERRHMYCSSLPNSEWFLVTIMPYGTLDETINNLSSQRINLLMICIAVVLIVLITIFVIYFKISQGQIHNLEEARQEAIQANKAKSEFLSNMSHDIRTPMNAIVGMTSIASANIDNKQQIENCLKKITLSSKHLLGLINDILDMSKIESGKLTLNTDQVSLQEIMNSLVNIIQPQIKAKNQHFNVFIHDIETENVCCDSVRLNQVLLNLLSNAIKFTPDGGLIHVSLYEEPSPVSENFVRVHISVKDSGIGMSKEFKEKIFESFTREDSKRVHKTEGTGLGMAITKYIVDAMHGTIEVESKKGEGTEFHVVLDLEKAQVQENEMVLPNWNVLVVDNDEQLCESAVCSLNSIGVNADFALSGEDALKLIKDHHNRHDDYQIILLDWKLPGMDGIETACEISKQIGDHIPILLISAYDWSEIEDNARKAGVNGFISKPLFKSTLFYGLRQYMDNFDQNGSLEEDSEDNFNGTKVLVAEDNDLNWEIANELLSALGLELEHAENGQICADMFKDSPVGYYSAILMDIRMPIMNGYEATEEIRKTDRSDSDIPIIAMTADAFAEDAQRCLDCGMNAHISKPIDVKEVSRQLKKHIK